MLNWIFLISCFHFAKHLEKQCCWHGRSSKKILTRAYKDYGTLKRNFMPWLQVTKIVCIFYSVSLHISFPLTPTPLTIDRDVTGVWVDVKFIITVVANKGNPRTFPGKRHLAIQSIRPHFTDWFIMVCKCCGKCKKVWEMGDTKYCKQLANVPKNKNYPNCEDKRV
jgi:hypothetical protein